MANIEELVDGEMVFTPAEMLEEVMTPINKSFDFVHKKTGEM